MRLLLVVSVWSWAHYVYSGDIVIARSPTNARQHICKRVAAVEGDTVSYLGYGRDVAYVSMSVIHIQ